MPPSPNSCLVNEASIEVITEGNRFASEMDWNILDLYGHPVIGSNSTSHNRGHQTTYGCVPDNTCHTFLMRDKFGFDSSNNTNTRGLFTIKIDNVTIFSGSNHHTDQHLMLGASCFGNGRAICSNDQDSLFRLELAGDTYAGDISWKLLDVSDNTLYSAGPFEDCSVNTFASCLSQTQCYKFFAMNNSEKISDSIGSFTVLLSGTNGYLQSYTSDFSLATKIVYLGSCYDVNFA